MNRSLAILTSLAGLALNAAHVHADFAPPSDAPVAAQIKSLEDKEMRNRVDEILYKLGGKGGDAASAVPAIIKQMKAEPYQENQKKCARALGQIGEKGAAESVPALLELMRGDEKKRNDEVAATAAIALGQIGPAAKDAIPDLVAALDNEYRLGSAAVIAVGLIGPDAKDAAPKLRERLIDPKEKQRAEAAAKAAAKAAANPNAKPPKPPRVEKPDDRFLVKRAAAEWALGAIGEPAPEGGKSWQQLALDDYATTLLISDAYTAASVPTVLVAIGEPAVPMLTEALKTQKTWDLASRALAEMNNPIRSSSDSDFRRPMYAKPWKDKQRLKEVSAKTREVLVTAIPDLIALVNSDQASGSFAAEVLGVVCDDAHRQEAIDAMAAKIQKSAGNDGARYGLIAMCPPARDALAVIAKDTSRPFASKAAQEALLQIGGADAATASANAMRQGTPQDQLNAARALEQGGAAGIPAMIAALKDFEAGPNRLKVENYEVSNSIVNGLKRNRDAAIPKLIEATRGSDRNTALGAAWMLGQLNADEAAPAVIALMGKAQNENERRVCTDAVAVIWQKSPAAAVAALKDPSAEVRRIAAGSLRYIDRKDADVSLALLDAVDDPDAEVAKNAKEALFQQQGAAIAMLAKMVKDPKPQMRAKAALALGAFDQPEARTAMLAATTDAEASVREAAIHGLFNARGTGQWPPTELVVALNDKDASVRLAAAESLGDRPNELALASLGKLLLHDPDAKVRAAAANSMTLQQQTSPPASVVQALSDEDPQVRSTVASGLLRINVEPLVPALSAMLKHEDSLVRVAAVHALSRPEAADASRDVRPLLKDPDVAVRAAAAAALGKLVAPDSNPMQDLAMSITHEKEEVVRIAAVNAISAARSLVLHQSRGKGPTSQAFKATTQSGAALDSDAQAAAVFAAFNGTPKDADLKTLAEMLSAPDATSVAAAMSAASALRSTNRDADTFYDQIVAANPKAKWAVMLARGVAQRATPEQLDALRQTTKDTDTNIAAVATLQLRRASPSDVPVDSVVALLKSDQATIRADAAMALTTNALDPSVRGNASAVQALLDRLEDPSIAVAHAAAQALSSCGALGDGSRVIGTKEEEEKLALQFGRLNDVDPVIRKDAINITVAAGRSGAMFVPQWVNLLSDPSPEVRKVAAGALKRFNKIRFATTHPQ